MTKILFQGDSITDVGRARDNDEQIGRGYPHLIKSVLGFEEGLKFEFVNRGISGSRIVDLYANIKMNIINLKPDVMSILIGVNDVWHELGPNHNGVDADKFYRIYCMLIEEIKSALPNIKIMIMEPFVLKASATEKQWDLFSVEVEKRAKISKKVAEEFGLTFIPLQEKFNEVSTSISADFWLADGVHPTEAGHELIKREWLSAFEMLKDKV